MKLLPTAVTLCCAALLFAGCRRTADNAEIEKQVQERLDEEHQAQQERQLHEQQAALDERERLITEREQQLAIVVASPPATPAPSIARAPAAAVTPTQAPAVAVDTSYQLFYDILSPYGSWLQMPGYGYVWQPLATVENGRWRPYSLGHWVFTDDGWTWISDEPFGWITYHYGRWMRTHTMNWVWVPGDQWAPAWVSWRYGNDFVGWAPLPPEARFDGVAGIQQWADQQYGLGASDYTFIPAADFGDGDMASAAVPPDENEPIYDDSDNVTNIYYDSGAYAIICYGPNYDFMRSKSRRPLGPQLRLRNTGYVPGGSNGTVVAGNTLQVTAPRITGVAGAPKSVRTRVVDVRVVSPAGTPPPHGSALPPLYHPPQTASNAPATGMQIPSRMNPTPIPQNAPEPVNNAPAPAATGMRIPSQMQPAPLAPDVEAQKARDLEVIQERQAEEQEQKRKEEADALAAQQQAAQQQAEQRRADETARAAREQVARDQAARQVPAQVQAQPMGSPGVGRP